jgi:hypothetical protein
MDLSTNTFDSCLLTFFRCTIRGAIQKSDFFIQFIFLGVSCKNKVKQSKNTYDFSILVPNFRSTPNYMTRSRKNVVEKELKRFSFNNDLIKKLSGDYVLADVFNHLVAKRILMHGCSNGSRNFLLHMDSCWVCEQVFRLTDFFRSELGVLY